MLDVPAYNDSTIQAREAFLASRVGEMNPGYPEEMQILQGLKPAGLEQPDLPTDRSVWVGQPHTTVTW